MLAVVYAVGAIMLCQNSDILKKINNNNNNNSNNNKTSNDDDDGDESHGNESHPFRSLL
jgi:hypothetical protein